MRAFIPNPGFAAALEESDEYRAGLESFADEVMAKTEAFARAAGAPWMPRSGHDLIEVQVTEDGVYVVNTDYAGHLQEWGSIRNPPHAPLRRGASAAGLRLEETPA